MNLRLCDAWIEYGGRRYNCKDIIDVNRGDTVTVKVKIKSEDVGWLGIQVWNDNTREQLAWHDTYFSSFDVNKERTVSIPVTINKEGRIRVHFYECESRARNCRYLFSTDYWEINVRGAAASDPVWIGYRCYIIYGNNTILPSEGVEVPANSTLEAVFGINANGYTGEVAFQIWDERNREQLLWREHEFRSGDEIWRETVEFNVGNKDRDIYYVMYKKEGGRWRQVDACIGVFYVRVRAERPPRPPERPPEERPPERPPEERPPERPPEEGQPLQPPILPPEKPPNPKIPEGIYVFPYRGRIVMINNTWNDNKVSVVDKLLFIPIGGGEGVVEPGKAVILAYEHILSVIEVYSQHSFTVLNEKGQVVARNVKYWKFVSII